MSSKKKNNPKPDHHNNSRNANSATVENGKKTSRVTLIIFLFLALGAFLPLIRYFIVPLILAITFTTLFYPAFKVFLRLTGNRRKLSSLLCCICFLVGLIIPVYLMFNLAVGQVTTLLSYASEEYIPRLMENGAQGRVSEFIENSPLTRALGLGISDIEWGTVLEDLLRQTYGVLSFIINRTYSGLFGLLINFLVLFFTMFYFFADGPHILNRIRELLPLKSQYEDMIIKRFSLISRATVLGTLIIGLAQGAAGGITLLFSGVQSWLLWALIMMILSIIPLVGAWLVLIPAAVIQILLGNVWTGIGIFISSTFIVSNIDNLIRPRIVGREAKIHDLIIFFSTLGGLSLFGVMGFIVGPATASVFLTFVDIYRKEFRSEIQSIKES
ncbi:putative membrane protein [Chitinispirillum alkaliphilum]|nr:putative membrane protein [Chitinispirillum alkaliphilum]